ncbi:MAG: SDR family oxidoreductase [Actinobacteria bacterium]|nr:SDR family oxidoreductase [Actinomycetota bacterium]
MRLNGKVALIVGSTYGIGKTIAEFFAQEGAKVVISGRSDDKGEEVMRTIKKNGGEASFCHCDAGISDEINNLIKFAIKKYARLDVLVNNALYLHPLELSADIVEKEWDKTINVILKGTFMACKYAIPEMIKSGGGSIININSIGGVLGLKLHTGYNAAKGGVINLTRGMALDYGSQQIRINAICPGIIATPHTQHEIADKKIRESLLKKCVVGRIGKPEDVAYAALYFASDESSFVTGAVLMVDGGWSAIGNNENNVYDF